MSNNYSANDIVSLSAGRAFREKIGMYLSADRQEAINLGLRELIVNVQDEFEVYKPENPLLKISLNSKTKEISVEDNMRGIPVGIRDDGMNSLTAAFMVPHSGGKHQEGAYVSSVGINGEGNKVVNHTAKWLEVQVKRDGNIYYQKFSSTSEGATPECDVKIKGKTNETGTLITYVPDPEVYGDIFIHYDNLRSMLKEMSYFTKGLKILLIIDGEEETFYSENGLIDGLNSEFALSRPFSYFYETDDCKVELALQWVSKRGQIKGYANGLYMREGGAFISGFKSSLTRTFNSLMKKSFSGEQIRNMLDGFVSVKVKVGQFSNQAKTALANPEARTATSTAISQSLKEYILTNENDLKNVCELLTKYEKAEKAADRAREAILNHNKEMASLKKNKINFIDKLSDAEVLGQDAILCICEGDSAGSSVALGRDTKKHGILRIKGKMLNTLKSEDEKIYQNEEIKLLLYALGIDVNNYNPQKLRYGKVAICADQDDDGLHVALLIIANLYKLCPKFLEENRLFWLQSPLYIEQDKNNNPISWYYSDEEFDKVRKTIKGNVKRVKGLGQLSEKDLHATMFSTTGGQRMDEIIYSEEGAYQLCQLMGEDIAPRKEFIFNRINFSEYGSI